MKLLITLFLSFSLIIPHLSHPPHQERLPYARRKWQPQPPDLSTKILFNGKDLSGWHIDVPALDEDPTVSSPFIVRNGMLVSLASPRGHIITDAAYQNYSLTVEYRFVGEAGNCGVLVHTTVPRVFARMFPQSLEVQMRSGDAGDFVGIHEDITVPNMEERRGPPEKWGSTRGTQRRIPNLTDDSENIPGEWNRMIIECFGDEIKVWVNGDLVNYGYNCTTNRGQIALQAEGSEVEFRKIELTPIVPLTE